MLTTGKRSFFLSCNPIGRDPPVSKELACFPSANPQTLFITYEIKSFNCKETGETLFQRFSC
jgi:hypothetical protein